MDVNDKGSASSGVLIILRPVGENASCFVELVRSVAEGLKKWLGAVWVEHASLRAFHLQKGATDESEDITWQNICLVARTYLSSSKIVIVDDLRNHEGESFVDHFLDFGDVANVVVITIYNSENRDIDRVRACSIHGNRDGRYEASIDWSHLDHFECLEEALEIVKAASQRVLPRREGTFSVKSDLYPFARDTRIQAWVADMDFCPPPHVQTALINRFASSAPFGYTYQPVSMWEAVSSHLVAMHGWTVSPKMLRYSPSVVTSAFLAISAFTREDDCIVAFSPMYAPLFEVVTNSKRTLVKIPLQLDSDSRYTIDFDNLKHVLIANDAKAFILCNPHNPGGRVWLHGELTALSSICKSLNVLVLSDEIHSDLVLSETSSFVPFGSVAEGCRYITFMAPTKTFNLAGLKSSFLVLEDSALRTQYDDASTCSHIQYGGVVATTIFPACYCCKGRQYIVQLRARLRSNINFLKRLIEQSDLGLTVYVPEASFLVWIQGPPDILEWFTERAKIAVSPGFSFGDNREMFNRYIRLNIATSHQALSEIVRLLTESKS